MRFIIVTGMSGAGKTQTLRILEDRGFYCVDNLPPMLIPEFVGLCLKNPAPMENIAVGVDLRGGIFFSAIGDVLKTLRELKIAPEIIYLDASDEALILRFKETRRPHPLGADRRLAECIAEERDRLEPIRHMARHVVNSTGMSTRELRQHILALFAEGESGDGLNITVASFGFKRGIPLDADIVWDVRFIANPFHDPVLRKLTGLTDPVRDYVLSQPETGIFLDQFTGTLLSTLPCFVREGKNQVVIAIGCTGGVHRSVTIACCIAERLKEAGYHVKVDHRDIQRESATHELLRPD